MTDSLDTNVMLRYIFNDIPEQKQKVIGLLSENNLMHYVSNQAITEVVYVMESVYEASRPEIADAVNFFLTRYDGVILYDREMTTIAFPLYLAHPKLSWTDCVLAAEAEAKHHEPLMTFDQKLASQAPQAKLIE